MRLLDSLFSFGEAREKSNGLRCPDAAARRPYQRD
jgi:hypothetical protein